MIDLPKAANGCLACYAEQITALLREAQSWAEIAKGGAGPLTPHGHRELSKFIDRTVAALSQK
jgi:hypothetical protein